MLPMRLLLSFRLNVAARVTLRVQRLLPGRMVGGRCVRLTAGNARHAHCLRALPVRGATTVRARAGINRVTFVGVSRGRDLGAGLYRLLATPVAAGQRGLVRAVKFRLHS